MCGVVGLSRSGQVIDDILIAMSQLQHRGQDGAGIAAFSSNGEGISLHRGPGLLNDAIDRKRLAKCTADFSIGHLRYVTSGVGAPSELQPSVAPSQFGDVALCFNGNIINYLSLQRQLGFQSSSCCSDGQVLSGLFSKALGQVSHVFDALAHATKVLYDKLLGSYSVVGLIDGHGMFFFRDPKGIRPLVMGTCPDREDCAVASETYPLSLLGFRDLEDIRPGELVFVDARKKIHRREIAPSKCRHCSFEYVYFARGNATLEQRSVYQVRSNLGRSLAKHVKRKNISVDVVVGVPSTSQPAALSLAWELGLRMEEGFLRKDYCGRSFIMPTDEARRRLVRQKLAPVESVFRGKHVLIVDDSIVRGTVSSTIIETARACGARSVYFGSTFPPIRHPCYYGVDFPNPACLIAFERSEEEVARQIGANAVIYNTEEDLVRAIGVDSLCLACINGSHPTCTKDAAKMGEQRTEDMEVGAL